MEVTKCTIVNICRLIYKRVKGDSMKKNFKLSRNLWLITGFIWIAMLLEKLSMEGLSLYTLLRGITVILCFFNAYRSHKSIIKDSEN